MNDEKKKNRRSELSRPSGEYPLPRMMESGDLDDATALPDLPVTNLEWLFEKAKEDDRRSRWRAPYPDSVRVSIYGREFAARGIDISMGGISFQPVPYWVKKGDPVLIEMQGPVRKLIGRVVWLKPMDDGTDNTIIGVRFASEDEHSPVAR